MSSLPRILLTLVLRQRGMGYTHLETTPYILSLATHHLGRDDKRMRPFRFSPGFAHIRLELSDPPVLQHCHIQAFLPSSMQVPGCLLAATVDVLEDEEDEDGPISA
jgi:hypothetical protein